MDSMPCRRSRARIFPGCNVFACLVPNASHLDVWNEEDVQAHQYLVTVLGKSRKHGVVKEFLVDFGAIPYDSPKLVGRFIVGFEDDRRLSQFQTVLARLGLKSHRLLGTRSRAIGHFPEVVLGEAKYVKPHDSPPHSAHVLIRFEPRPTEPVLEFLFPEGGDIFPAHDREMYLAELHRGLVYAMHRGLDWGVPFGGLRVTFLGGTFNPICSRPLSFRYAAALSFDAAINQVRVLGKEFVIENPPSAAP